MIKKSLAEHMLSPAVPAFNVKVLQGLAVVKNPSALMGRPVGVFGTHARLQLNSTHSIIEITDMDAKTFLDDALAIIIPDENARYLEMVKEYRKSVNQYPLIVDQSGQVVGVLFACSETGPDDGYPDSCGIIYAAHAIDLVRDQAPGFCHLIKLDMR